MRRPKTTKGPEGLRLAGDAAAYVLANACLFMCTQSHSRMDAAPVVRVMGLRTLVGMPLKP